MLAAIDNAGRDEFVMIGGAGSKNAMEAIKAGNSVLKATVIYPSTQGADGIEARPPARPGARSRRRPRRGRGPAPRSQLYAPVVTAENVDTYLPSAFTS